MNPNNIVRHLNILGLRVKDKVTGFSGVAVTLSFDLYGCIQVVINPGLDKDGKQLDCVWFDISRLDITDPLPVMQRPNYELTPEDIAAGNHGPAEKPFRQW